MHRLTATDTPMVRYTRTIFPSYALLIKKYKKYLKIDTNSSTVTYNDNLISKMNEEGENEIQIYEIQNCM